MLGSWQLPRSSGAFVLAGSSGTAPHDISTSDWFYTMSIDPYAMCPCGSGKKLKFCCADVVGEIERIHRMIEGDQPRAALRHTEQALASHPKKASLLDLRATLEMLLEDLEAARSTVDQFVAAHPDSPNAFACQAMLLAETEEPREAVRALQKALSLIEHDMPQRVFEAIGVVGQSLLIAGHVAAAQAHLWMHAAIAPPDDERSRQLLVSLNHYAGLPLLLRDQLVFRPWPIDEPWRAEAEKASRLVDSGKWLQAVGIIDQLGQQYGAHPTLVYNRALLGGWLADERAMVAGLHAFAQMDVPLDDAIEAEAIAQLLDPDLKEVRIDSLLQTYEIKDLDTLVAALTSDRRATSFKMNPAAFGQSDQPRPRHTFILFDKPLPDSGVNITREELPKLTGILAIYGRQTDRPERLELTVDRGDDFEATISVLREIGGDALGSMTEEKAVSSVSPTEQALNRRWRFPDDTPLEVRRRILAEERRVSVVERWPTIARPGLAGKTPQQAASDAELRIPLMAAVLILEHGGNNARDEEAFAELRRKLNLPAPGPIELAAGGEYSQLPLVRVPRLNLGEVADEDIVALYRRSLLVGANAAMVALAREAVNRPSLAQRIPTKDAYSRMIAAEADLDRAMALLNEARDRSRAAGESTAHWDLAELELHISMGNAEQARMALEVIEREHMDDPHVAAQLYQLLYGAGMVSLDDMGMEPSGDDLTAPAAVGSAADPGAGGIWTPGSDRPSGGKSTLWVPT